MSKSNSRYHPTAELKPTIGNLHRVQTDTERAIDRILDELPAPTAALRAINILRDRLLSEHPEIEPLIEDDYSTTNMFVEEILNGIPGNFYPVDLWPEAVDELALWFADNIDFTTLLSDEGDL
jgi:hypothetical protein